MVAISSNAWVQLVVSESSRNAPGKMNSIISSFLAVAYVTSGTDSNGTQSQPQHKVSGSALKLCSLALDLDRTKRRWKRARSCLGRWGIWSDSSALG